MHLLSGIDSWESIQVRVATDKQHLVVSVPMSSNISNPTNALKQYMLKQKKNHEVAKEWPDEAVDYMLDKHKKLTARNISISKLKNRDINKEIVFEDRISLGRNVYLSFADTTGDVCFFSVKGL